MIATPKSAWGDVTFAVEDVAFALGCASEAAYELISVLRPSSCPSGMWKVELAVMSALNMHAGIELPVTAGIVRARRELCASVLLTLDFFPHGDGQGQERDPFMFFAPDAGDVAAVPAIDHYIDVLDGRRISWRKPRNDPYRLACELHRLSNAVKRDDTPALQEQYLELLSRLTGPVAQDSTWLGTVRDGAFRPAPERFAETSPAMRQGPWIEADATWSANGHGMCVSVNVSLAARCFKRRMMGLRVGDPFAPRSQTKTKTERTQVPV